MKNEMPHITAGLSPADPFLPSGRSKTLEHTDRTRSDYTENIIIENYQKSMKNEENQR